jgi:hypothetical protein
MIHPTQRLKFNFNLNAINHDKSLTLYKQNMDINRFKFKSINSSFFKL